MKQAVLVLLISLTVLIAGCTGQGGTSTTRTSPFVGGTEGIQLDFVEGSPPLEVGDGGQYPFDITLRLLNKGETDVDPGNVLLSLQNIDPSEWGGEYTKPAPEQLVGTHKDMEGNVLPGTTAYATFSGFNYNKRLLGNTQFTVRADMCYGYRTQATTMLCVKKDLNKPSGEAICKVTESKQIFSSGSPIQIEDFKQSPAGNDKLSFSFTVAHKGTGAVYGFASPACDESFSNKNKVRITVDTGMGSGAVCSGLTGGSTGEVLLPDGKRPIVCTQDTSGATTIFEKPITITVEFDYKQHKDVTLLVKHSS